MLLMSRNANSGERDIRQGQHQLPKVILQSSYSSSLNQKIFTEQLSVHISHKNQPKLGILIHSRGPTHQLHLHVVTKRYFFRESGGGRKSWQGQKKLKEKDCQRRKQLGNKWWGGLFWFGGGCSGGTVRLKHLP